MHSHLSRWRAPELQIHANLSGYTTFSEERRLSASLSGVPFSSINTVNKALPVSVTVSFSSQHGDGASNQASVYFGSADR